MQELLKNLLYLGAGAAFVTKEKIEELKSELVDKGKLTQDEGKQFVDDLLNKSDDIKGKFEEKIQEVVIAQLDKLNVAKSEDIAELRAQRNEEIAELRAQKNEDIAELRAQIKELRGLIEKKQKS